MLAPCSSCGHPIQVNAKSSHAPVCHPCRAEARGFQKWIAPCSSCGTLVRSSKSGICNKCRADRRNAAAAAKQRELADRPCANCGNPIGNGIHAFKYCSKSCRLQCQSSPSRPIWIIDCARCHQPVTARTARVKHCKRTQCRKAIRAEEMRKYAARRKEREPDWYMGNSRVNPKVACVHCGKPMFKNKGSESPVHSACRAAFERRAARIGRAQAKLGAAAVGTSGGTIWTQGSCGRCGQDFCHKGTIPARYCTRSCKTRDASSRRRALEANAFVSHVSRAKVFAADGYRCYLCRKLCDRTATVPHPNAPTVDHVIPLARGGTHEPSNCRTACFGCNCTKGAYGSGEQLLLLA